MRIDIISVLPEMIEGFVHESILARAERKGWRKSACTTCVTTRSTNGVVWMTIRMAVLPEWSCSVSLLTDVLLP